MQYCEDDLKAIQDINNGVSLILNISSDDVSGFGSRADGEDAGGSETSKGTYSFVQATIATEKMQSLRIIIVDTQDGSETKNKVIKTYYSGDLTFPKSDIS